MEARSRVYIFSCFFFKRLVDNRIGFSRNEGSNAAFMHDRVKVRMCSAVVAIVIMIVCCYRLLWLSTMLHVTNLKTFVKQLILSKMEKKI